MEKNKKQNARSFYEGSHPAVYGQLFIVSVPSSHNI